MLQVPELTDADVEAAIKRTFVNATRKHTILAIYGQGTESVVEGVKIIPVSSEFELRARMPPLESSERIAFLVPWVGQVPVDLIGRFALQGEVQRVNRETRLKALFGVSEVGPSVTELALAKYLLEQKQRPGFKAQGGRLTQDALWQRWLQHTWQFPTKEFSLSQLMAWAASNDRGSLFLEEFSQEANAPVREELLAYLERKLGIAAPVVWRAWEQGKGRWLLEHSALFEVLGAKSDQPAVAVWLAQPCDALKIPEAERSKVVCTLGAALAQALFHYEGSLGASDTRRLLRDAEEHVRVDAIRKELHGSIRLPIGWSVRQDALGSALTHGVEVSGADRQVTHTAVLNAVERFNSLNDHVAAKEPEAEPFLSRAEMALRLLTWLCVKDYPEAPEKQPYFDAVELGGWYSDDGGFVDRARRLARGSSDTGLGLGIQSVVLAADKVRAELDRRFAVGLQDWYAAGTPTEHAVSIEQVSKRVVDAFLQGHAERKLLVLLMDGMAWAQAVEILESLGNYAAPWAPLAWHRDSGRKLLKGGTYPAMFANVPTLTEISRAALFAGKRMAPGNATATNEDAKRWRDNPIAKSYYESADGPQLKLRPEGHNLDGSATTEAITHVKDKERRLVAMVINAIDASLKSDTQQQAHWNAESIRSLPALLEAAREVGRSVLLVADHGHVPGDRLKSVGSFTEAGARWRPWKKGEAVAAHELVFQGKQVYHPRGYDGVVLLFDETSRYGGAAHAGEHGGASLAEVVAPCVLIGCTDHPNGFKEDEELKPIANYQPAWWHYADWARSTSAVGQAAVPVAPSPPTKKPKVSEKQLSLIPEETPPAVVASAKAPEARGAVAATMPPSDSAFARCELLKLQAPKKELRDTVVRAVDLLVDRGGAMTGAAFAREFQQLERRLAGFVVKLQEVLNIEGYPVLRYDPQNNQLHLDKALLEQQFEVKL